MWLSGCMVVLLLVVWWFGCLVVRWFGVLDFSWFGGVAIRWFGGFVVALWFAFRRFGNLVVSGLWFG